MLFRSEQIRSVEDDRPVRLEDDRVTFRAPTSPRLVLRTREHDSGRHGYADLDGQFDQCPLTFRELGLIEAVHKLFFTEVDRVYVEVDAALADLLEREVSDRKLAGASVSLDLDGNVRNAEILGDPVALRRLFANLTDNAIAYGGEAKITAATNGERLTVTVDDRGSGIDKTLRETVFEPFVRLEESRNRNTGGAGLGLAIARKVAEAHGGTLTLSDAPGGGTRAIVELPLFLIPAKTANQTR